MPVLIIEVKRDGEKRSKAEEQMRRYMQSASLRVPQAPILRGFLVLGLKTVPYTMTDGVYEDGEEFDTVQPDNNPTSFSAHQGDLASRLIHLSMGEGWHRVSNLNLPLLRRALMPSTHQS